MSPPVNPPRTKEEKLALIHGSVAPPTSTARSRRTSTTTLTATTSSPSSTHPRHHQQGIALPRPKTTRNNVQPARTKAEKWELLYGKQPQLKHRRTSKVVESHQEIARPTRATMILSQEDDDDEEEEDSFIATPPLRTTFAAPTMLDHDDDDNDDDSAQPQQLAIRVIVPMTITFRVAVSTGLVLLVVVLATYKNDPVSWILAFCFAMVFLERIITTTTKLE